MPLVSRHRPPGFLQPLRSARRQPEQVTALADIKTAGIPVFAYGNFLTILVNFAILAFVIFMMVKINRLRAAGCRPPSRKHR